MRSVHGSSCCRKQLSYRAAMVPAPGVTHQALAVPDVSPDHAPRQFCFRGRGACAKLRSVLASALRGQPNRVETNKSVRALATEIDAHTAMEHD
jgi:hypothetical protein